MPKLDGRISRNRIIELHSSANWKITTMHGTATKFGVQKLNLPEYRPVEFSMNAVYPHRHHLSAKVRGFIDLLVQHNVEHQRLINPFS